MLAVQTSETGQFQILTGISILMAPLVNRDVTGSGYAVAPERTVIEAGSQRAELWVLVWTLQLSKGKEVNIWHWPLCVFATLHVHGVLYRERGLLRANGKDIKN